MTPIVFYPWPRSQSDSPEDPQFVTPPKEGEPVVGSPPRSSGDVAGPSRHTWPMTYREKELACQRPVDKALGSLRQKVKSLFIQEEGSTSGE